MPADARAPVALVLASKSPRRASLLSDAGYAFDVVASRVDENDVPAGLSPTDLVRLLAERKARRVASMRPDAVVLGADTVASFDDRILGKPVDHADARRMLAELSGTSHQTITGVAVIAPQRDEPIVRHEVSNVHMRTLEPREIEAYLNTGLWQAKAGGYGIQDDDPFVTAMTGEPSNVMGLPMSLVSRLLAEVGVVPAEVEDG